MTTAYTDYAYYTGTYLGVAIASTDFARLALRASATIDQLTYNRAAEVVAAATDLTTIDSIEMATCALAEEIQREELAGGDDAIQSESIGRNSVTYAANSVKAQTNVTRQKDTAALYLGSTGLMFKGFYTDEYGGAIDAA